MIVNETVDQLVLAYQRGDPDALGALWESLEPAIKTAIRRVSTGGLPPSVSHDDVLQESYIVLGEMVTHWEPRGVPFVTYIWNYFERILRRWLRGEHGCDSAGRRRCISVPHDHLANSIGAYTIRGSVCERAVILSEMLSVLPADERRAVELSVLAEESFERIGLAMGTSRATAHRAYAKGLARLRATVGASP